MSSHGFAFACGEPEDSSGGRFAKCEFQRGDRRLEFHFRYSLGLVTYHLGTQSISHESYMWSVLDRRHASHYPGFSAEPLESFRTLLLDLEQSGGDFLSGTDAAFLRHLAHAEELRLGASTQPA